jgi:ferric-dicitrate binding protein FerR (iron transport regulator)
VNAESSIRYPVTFASNERVVHVDGEAFFDVVKDDSKPFVVKTNDYSVRVLGTKFNVKCYTDEDFVATTLVSGSVSIPTSLGEEKVISPGEQLRLNRNDRTVTVSKVDTEIYTSWINNTITLRETPLHEIVSQLRRRYDVQFVFEDSSLRDETFTGVVPLNESLNTILSMFSKVSSVDFRVEDGVVFIGKNS